MIEDNEIIEAPRRSWAWAFCKVAVLGAAVGALTYGGSETMSVVRREWPLIKAEASTHAWELYDSLDRALVSDQELIEMYAAQHGQDPGMIALITGVARAVPGAQLRSCQSALDRRELARCQVTIVRDCYVQSKGARDKSGALYATLGCIGGTTWQQAAMREVSEVLIEEKV